MLLAFAVQSYVVQTHIHLAPDAFTTTGTSSVAKSPAAGPQRQQPDKFPARDDPANCPICQEILHSGQFVTPQVAAALLPTLSVSIVAIVVHVAVVPETTSHAWQSRGPPQH